MTLDWKDDPSMGTRPTSGHGTLGDADQARNDRRALVKHMLSYARTYSALELDVLHEATQRDLQDVDSLRVTP